MNIEFVSGGAGELITRVTGEAAAPNGDVFMAGLLNTDGDAYSDLFEHYLTPYEDEVMDGYQSDNGFYNYNALSTVCLCYIFERGYLPTKHLQNRYQRPLRER